MGAPVGMFKSNIFLSFILSIYFTKALKELPWATINIFFPFSKSGLIELFQ